MSGTTAPSSFQTWLYNVTPSWLGGSYGAPQQGPTQFGTPEAPVTLDQSLAGQSLGASSPDLVKALQELSKSPLGKQPDSAALPPARITEVPAGRPRQAGSLDALVQLLERQRAQYGGLSGQPVAQPRTLGLLGF